MTIRLQSIETREIRLPLREPFTISSGTMHTRRILLVRATDADGHVAWAECVAGEDPNYSPETIDTCALALREWIVPRVLDRPFEDPAAVHAALEENFRGHRMAKACVEMATWCVMAEQRDESLSQLVGGTRDRIPTGISLGIQADPAALAAKVTAALAEGYRKVKIKIKPGADVDYLRAARDVAGPDAHLMADANNAYTLDDADLLVGLDDLDLIMVEQPLAWDDVVQHAELQRRMRTPICLDESIANRERARDMIALGSGRIVNIKPGRVGGFTESIAIHDLCLEHDIPVWCGGMLESGIGRAYNVALASLPNFTLPGDVSPSARYWERDVVAPEWTMSDDGHVTVPRDRPGLGVDVDEGRIDDLTVERNVWNA